jgi:hypothetical protein
LLSLLSSPPSLLGRVCSLKLFFTEAVLELPAVALSMISSALLSVPLQTFGRSTFSWAFSFSLLYTACALLLLLLLLLPLELVHMAVLMPFIPDSILGRFDCTPFEWLCFIFASSCCAKRLRMSSLRKFGGFANLEWRLWWQTSALRVSS